MTPHEHEHGEHCDHDHGLPLPIDLTGAGGTVDAPPVGPGTVVAIEYVLKNPEGEELDRATADEPIVYLHGQGVLVDGLEESLTGRRVGEPFEVTLPPDQAFGDHDPDAVHWIPRSALPDDRPIEVGTAYGATTDDGEEVTFWVTHVEEDRVVANENHPLAGVTLCFEGRVLGVRPATEAELAESRLLEGQ